MIAEKICKEIQTALSDLYQSKIDLASIQLEKTRKDFTGDFTFVVFPYLKISRKSPEITAREIGDYLLKNNALVANYEVIKGFLNVSLPDSYWVSILKSPDHQAGEMGQENGRKKKIVLEFSSPNTNKPLHLGHVRNNLIGYAVSEILQETGHEVIKVNLVNDRGIHICKSMLAYMKWGDHETPTSSGIKGDHLIGKYYVLFDQKYKEQIEQMVSNGENREMAEKTAPLISDAQEILRKWEAGDTNVVELWKTMNSWVYEGFAKTYTRLGIRFDKIYYESSTYLLGKDLVSEGLKNGVFFRKPDGSIWVDLTSEGLDEKVLLRADGTSVYITQDLGTAQLRYDDFHPDGMIYVVGNEQNYHFEVLKKILNRLDKSFSDSIYHLSYGMVELPFGKMKSREGTVVDADDLMEEMFDTARKMTRELGKASDLEEGEANRLYEMVGLGALKYFILKVDPKKNMLFDPAESIDFNGHTGPFIQYTHARIKSLLFKAGWENIDFNAWLDKIEVLNPLEKEVIRQLNSFSEALLKAAHDQSPAVITGYVYELAKVFNQMYQELPVIREEEAAKRSLRLFIAHRTGGVIKKAMKLLGIDVPEKM